VARQRWHQVCPESNHTPTSNNESSGEEHLGGFITVTTTSPEKLVAKIVVVLKGKTTENLSKKV